jgi:AraC-like DNA-binding protein
MELPTENYKLLSDKKIIDQQGLVMIDVDSHTPVGIEYQNTFFFVLLCERGYAKLDYDFKPLELSTHAICIGQPGHMYKLSEVSEDYKARVIIMSPDLANKARNLNISHYNKYSGYAAENPLGHLTSEQFAQMNDAFNLLQTVSSLGKAWRESMILNVFQTILMMGHEFCPIPEDTKTKADLRISARFQEAVVNYYRESHEVDFYAHKFGLSPKYFAALVKSELKLSPRQWINQYVVMQAKSLLTQRNDLNIQQIAYLLGFKDQTTFCRFFKKHEGLTPSMYRNSALAS